MRVLVASSLALVLSGCGGGSANLTDPPEFITGARPAPGALRPMSRSRARPRRERMRFHRNSTKTGRNAGSLILPPPARRSVSASKTLPSISPIPRSTARSCSKERLSPIGGRWRTRRPNGRSRDVPKRAPCRVFYIDSGGDPAVREDRARAVLEQMGLPEGNNRWFLYDRAGGDQGWYELPGVADLHARQSRCLGGPRRKVSPLPLPGSGHRADGPQLRRAA